MENGRCPEDQKIGKLFYAYHNDLKAFLDGDRVKDRLTNSKKRHQSQNFSILGVF